MKSLIVTADDVGLDPGMTEGAIRAHRQGIVTACSIVANGRAFDDAVERLRGVPQLEVGVHLTLVEERSLTGLTLPGKYPAFLKAYLLRRITLPQIERELREQVEKVVQTGLRVTHLNGHQHLHVLPGVFDAVVRIARGFGIGYIRTIDDRGGRAGIARQLAVGGLNVFGRRARRRVSRVAANERTSAGALRTNEVTIGVAEAGHLIDVEHLLDSVEGVTELVAHPGIDVRGYGGWHYAWDQETSALCAPKLRDAIARRGITLMAPSLV